MFACAFRHSRTAEVEWCPTVIPSERCGMLFQQGVLIDTLAYQFSRTWEYREKSFLYYDWMSRDFFGFLASQSETKTYWLSPGAGQYVWRTGKFEYKATRCRNIAIDAINHASKDRTWSARQCWRSIYGTGYPA